VLAARSRTEERIISAPDAQLSHAAHFDASDPAMSSELKQHLFNSLWPLGG
jgi:hypothetical protein